MSDSTLAKTYPRRGLAWHGWLGLVLAGGFWILNWTLDGTRTHWGFFPMWLGYCLTIDALVYLRKGTSLLTRSWRKYVSLFLISAPVWWIFEVVNWRLQNWHYVGADSFTPFQFWVWATLSFTTVIPAVFGSAELAGSFAFINRLGRGPKIAPTKATILFFFCTGLVMFSLMWIWPRLFFPFIWISIYFIMEPINIWLGNPHLASWTKKGDWRPVITLWIGVLLTAFFWEMWNYLSYPKWVYHVPWGQFWHIFEMPLLGYGGYLPFALELFAIYHLVTGLLGDKDNRYLQLLKP
ncbi:MAG: hypothetical protein JSV61_00235 [Anaerolineales bacterium]|nr:MAG: hypothetical protein JSV61_00235 [Anaerolineales bacterium]